MKTTSKTTKTLLTTIILSAGLTSMGMAANAAPTHPPIHASSQADRQDMRQSTDLNDRIASLRSDLNQGQRSGRISRKEAARLTGKLDNITTLKRSYERSGRGLTNNEVRTLNAKLDTLSGQIRTQKLDHNRH
jgi:outer membrane murein-binding lipoprotein Lpp